MSTADDLKKDGYLLVKKSAFLGGFLAVVGAVGVTAWGSAKVAIDSSAVRLVVKEIEKLRDDSQAARNQALADAAEIHKILLALKGRPPVRYGDMIEIRSTIHGSEPQRLKMDLDLPGNVGAHSAPNLQVTQLEIQPWQGKQ